MHIILTTPTLNPVGTLLYHFHDDLFAFSSTHGLPNLSRLYLFITYILELLVSDAKWELKIFTNSYSELARFSLVLIRSVVLFILLNYKS